MIRPLRHPVWRQTADRPTDKVMGRTGGPSRDEPAFPGSVLQPKRVSGWEKRIHRGMPPGSLRVFRKQTLELTLHAVAGRRHVDPRNLTVAHGQSTIDKGRPGGNRRRQMGNRQR